MDDDWTPSRTREEAAQQLRANARAVDDGMPASPPRVATVKIRTPRQRISESRKRLGMRFLPVL